MDGIKYCQKEKGLVVYAWCIMTNHVHLIIATQGRPMEAIMRGLRRHTSVKLREAIAGHPGESRKEWIMWMMERAEKRNSNNNEWQFWRQDNHPIELCHPDMWKQKMDYIHYNPVVAGFVAKPEDYLWSSAYDYGGGNGMLEVEMVGVL